MVTPICDRCRAGPGSARYDPSATRESRAFRDPQRVARARKAGNEALLAIWPLMIRFGAVGEDQRTGDGKGAYPPVLMRMSAAGSRRRQAGSACLWPTSSAAPCWTRPSELERPGARSPLSTECFRLVKQPLQFVPGDDGLAGLLPRIPQGMGMGSTSSTRQRADGISGQTSRGA